MIEMDCPPDENTDSFASALVPLVDPENKGDPLSEKRLKEVIGEMKESGRRQRELRLLELRWGVKRLSFRDIGKVIGEEKEGRKGLYSGEEMIQAGDRALKVLGYFYRYYTRYGRLPPEIDEKT